MIYHVRKITTTTWMWCYRGCTTKAGFKTIGWAIISWLIFFASGWVTTFDWWSAAVAASIAVALKTPFYYVWEHAGEWIHRVRGHKPALEIPADGGMVMSEVVDMTTTG